MKQRIEKLRKELVKEKLDAALISSVASITYLSGYSNFSTIEREAYILVGKDFQYIITDGRYSEAVKREVPHLDLFERGNGRSTTDLLKKHKKQIKKLGIEEDSLTVSEHKALKKHFKNIKHFSVSRAVKGSDEIEKIKKACELVDKTFKFIVEELKTGATEKEIAFQIEMFIKKNGAELSFPSIVAFGANSSIPHHQTGQTKLQKGDSVLLDFGTKVDDYCSDMTRTVFFGRPNEKQKKIYEVVLKAQEQAVDFVNTTIKSGKDVKAAEVDKVARKYIKSRGYPSIPHTLGHGVGIEVHESPHLSPKSKDILKEGMVFSIEPGIYIPGFGGVRIEDLFVLEKRGLRQITTSPKNTIQL